MIVAMMSTACQKDEEETPEFQQLSFDSEAVLEKLPDGLLNASDEYAQECVEMIEDALDMSGFIDNMEVPDNAVRSSKKASGDTWTWTFTSQGFTWTFFWTYEEDNSKRYWTMDIQFGEGPRYDYVQAWEWKDGHGGEVIYNFNWLYIYEGDTYESEYEGLYWRYQWEQKADGSYEFSWHYDASDEEYNYFMRYEVTINSDGSGQIDYYFYDDPYYHMEWDATGAGSWAYYFGGTEMSGTWPAG